MEDIAAVAGERGGASVAQAEGIVRVYRRGAEEVRALDGVTLTLEPGAFVCLLGPSGAGKTTLLNLVGLMDLPTDGSLSVAGRRVVERGRPLLSEAKRDRLRRESIGFVFTEFFLMPTLSAVENVQMPLLWSGRRDRAYATELLERVGLGRRLRHRPSELSGGEMQRVAIARALVNRPRLLLADEPTGNVDTRTRDEILGLFRDLNRDGLTIVVATHDQEIADRVDRVIHLGEGRIHVG